MYFFFQSCLEAIKRANILSHSILLNLHQIVSQFVPSPSVPVQSKNINEDIKEMLLSRNTAFPRHQKRSR